MRLLFTFAGGEGHLQPLLPLACAAAVRGHEVVVSGAVSLGGVASSAGLRFMTSGPDVAPRRAELRPIDMEHEYRVVRDAYAGRFARARAIDLLAICSDRRPNVIMSDEFDYGAAIVAERLDVACATVVVNASGGFVRAAGVDEPMRRLRAEHGLAAKPAGGPHAPAEPAGGPRGSPEPARRDLVLSPFPPSFRDPADPLPANGRTFRPFEAPPGVAAGGRPLVYVTLGTFFNTESGDLLARILAGARRGRGGN